MTRLMIIFAIQIPLILASQLDMLTAITDPGNSYDMNLNRWQNKVSLYFNQYGTYGGYISYEKWCVGLDMPYHHRSMDYQRGAIDTLMHDNQFYLLPFVRYRYVSPAHKSDVSIKVKHVCESVNLTDRVAYRDDRQPLVVMEGNPQLKGTSRTNAEAEYTLKFGKRSGQMHAGAVFNYKHREVAQSVTYAPGT